MKKLLTHCIFPLVLSCQVLCSQAATPPQPNLQSLDKVVAIVNNDVITQSEFNQAYAMAKLQMAHSTGPQLSPALLKTQVLNQLIDHKLELQTADRMGIKISDKEVEQAIGHIAESNHMSLDQLRTALASQGIGYATYQKQIKEQMTIQQLLQRAVGGSITITDQDLKNAQGQSTAIQAEGVLYQVGDILISLPDNPSPTQLSLAEKKAQTLKTQLGKGVAFDSLAMAHSDGPEASTGGNLGWRTINDLPTLFVQAIVGMQVGQVTGPIQAPNGLHILKLEGKKSTTPPHMITETDVRHILIKTNIPADDQPAKEMLESIRKQILAGASFADMAKRYSQDPLSAVKGGDLGWVPPGMMVPPFEQAMNSLAVNQISQPVKSQYGWHLIQVLGRKQVNDESTYQQNQLKAKVYNQQFNQNAIIWVQELRHDSYVKILD